MPLIPRFTLGIPYPTRLAVGVTQGKHLSLIPDFTLGIIYVLNAWTLLAVGDTQAMYICLLFKAVLHALRTLRVLLLAILKAMYASYSRLYSRHYVPDAGTPLAVGDTQGNVCLLFQALLSALRTQRRDTPCCCLLYTSPSPRDRQRSRMPSSA